MVIAVLLTLAARLSYGGTSSEEHRDLHDAHCAAVSMDYPVVGGRGRVDILFGLPPSGTMHGSYMIHTLHETNDMLRGIGLSVPSEDDRVYDPEFGYLSGYHLDHQPTVMNVAGWHDGMPVDMFGEVPFHDQMLYAEGMGFDYD